MQGFWTPVFELFVATFKWVFSPILVSAPEWLKPHLLMSEKPTHCKYGRSQKLDMNSIRGASDVDVTIDEGDVLTHHMVVPQVAKNEIARVVSMEVARVMPLRADKLKIAYAVDKEPGEAGIETVVVAVRKSVLDDLIGLLKAGNVRLRSISAVVADRRVYFDIPELMRRKYVKLITLVFSFFLFLLILAQAPSFYFGQLLEAVSETDTAIRQAKRNTSQISGLQKQVQTLQELSEAVSLVKAQNRPLALLAELTEQSPDTVIIDEFRLDGKRLYLSGRSTAPEEWVIQLQRNTMFDGVRLTSVIGQQDNMRRFEIHMLVQWQEGEASS